MKIDRQTESKRNREWIIKVEYRWRHWLQVILSTEMPDSSSWTRRPWTPWCPHSSHSLESSSYFRFDWWHCYEFFPPIFQGFCHFSELFCDSQRFFFTILRVILPFSGFRFGLKTLPDGLNLRNNHLQVLNYLNNRYS